MHASSQPQRKWTQAYLKQKMNGSALNMMDGEMPLGRHFRQYQNHFYAFLIDMNICILPVYIWVIEFLLIVSGLIPPNFFNALFYVMYALLFVTSVIGLGVYTARYHGQSLGYKVVNYRLVRNDLKDAHSLVLIFRQALSFGLPLMIFGFLMPFWGLAAWGVANMICVLASPHQQNIMDWILGLISVEVPSRQQQEQAEEEKPAQPAVPAEPAKITNPFMSSIDLHIRSSYSDDGFYDVEEIFKQAKQQNMEVISITDHNCARQNAPAVRFAKLYEIKYIPGAEFDCQYKGIRLRVLGYYIDWNNEIFDILERSSLKREKEISMERVQKFEKFSGIQIDVDSLIANSRFQTITDRDITRMVFNNEKTRALPFVQKYLDMASSEKAAMKNFERDVFGVNGPCYVKGDYPNIKTIIDAIHKAGGMAVLASWHLKRLSYETLQEIARMGIDGIECFSPELDERNMAALLKIVKENELFVSAGSDFHGPTKPSRHLGITNMPPKGEVLVKIFTDAAE